MALSAGLSVTKVNKIKKASAAGLIFYDHDCHAEGSRCHACGKKSPRHALSIHRTKEQMEKDAMSGEIILLGSECYKKYRDELGLEKYGGKK